MKKILIQNLNDEGPGDILGAIGGETEVDPSVIGDIDIGNDRAIVEVEGNGNDQNIQDKVESIVDQLDGEKVGRSEVSVIAMDEERLEKQEAIDDYVERYREMVELEREEEMRQHEEEIRNLSGRERESKGRAVLHLRSRDEGESIEGYKVKFMRNQKGEELPDTEITVGDLVMISKKDPLRDDNPTGTVIEKTNYSITVAFDGKPPGFVFSKNLRMDLYVNDITYQRMNDALEKIQNSENVEERVRNILIGDERPEEPEKKEIREWNNNDLNQSQKKAVKRSLGSKSFHLVHGPPGTGKTTTIIEVIEQLIDGGKTVLATADSNAAVDNILEFLLDRNVNAVRVGHPARVTPKLRENTLDALVEKNDKYREAEKAREKAFELKDKQDDLTHPSGRWRRGMSNDRIKQLAEEGRESRGVPQEKIEEMAEWLEIQEEADKLFEKSDSLEDEAVEEVLDSMDVVCATNSTSGSELMEGKMFDVVVIDEATQATEPSCLIPITHGEKVVMAGDHRQLPPTVKSMEAKQKGMEDTLFERLAEEYPEIKDLLVKQYRMNTDIMEFSSREFYDGKLEADESVKEHTLDDLEFDYDLIQERWKKALDPGRPAVFIDTKGEAPERSRQGSTSRENKKEAEIVEELVQNVLEAGLYQEDIAVISPYDDQVDLIGQKLGLEDLEVKTVDGFQGREKELVIISLVRSNDRGEIGFLEDYRRLNVALTRAKRKLVVIGNSDTLEEDETYQELYRYMKSNSEVIEVSRLPS